MKPRVIIVVIAAVILVLAGALLLSRCSAGSAPSDGSAPGSSTSASGAASASSSGSASGSGSGSGSAGSTATCDESMQKGARVKTDDPETVVHQHWTGSHLDGCSTVTLTFGSMSQHLVCVKATLPVVNGVVDGYVDFDYRSCKTFDETNIYAQ